MRNIEYVVLHSTYTNPNVDCGVKELDKRMRDMGYPCCPFHYVVRRNGIIEHGRPEYISSMYCGEHDSESISIAYEGGTDIFGNNMDTRTKEQIRVIDNLITNLQERFPNTLIVNADELRAMVKAS